MTTDSMQLAAPRRTRVLALAGLIAVLLVAVVAGVVVEERISHGSAVADGTAWLNYAVDQIDAEMIIRTEAAIEPLRALQALPDVGTEPGTTGHIYQHHMLDLVIREANLHAMYLGWSNGQRAEVRDLRGASEEARAAIQAPAETAYAAYWIWASPTGTRNGQWQFYKETLEDAGQRTNNAPRSLPGEPGWYAAGTGGLSASAPHALASNGQPGLVVSYPLRGGALVGAVDFAASWYQEGTETRSTNFAPGSTVAVVAGDGTIVGTAGTPPPRRDAPALRTVADLGSPAVSAAVALHAQNGDYAPRLADAGGERILATVRTSEVALGEGPTILSLTVPLSVFETHTFRGFVWGIAAALGVIVLLMGGLLLASRLVVPRDR